MAKDNTFKAVPANALRQLMSIAKIGSWIWNLSSGVIHYSKEYANLLGYEPEELTCDVTAWESLVLPDDLHLANEEINNCLAGITDSYVAEFRMLKKDGSVIWAQDKGSVTEYDKDGNPYMFCGVLQDVTRLKTAEFDLVEQQYLLRLAIEVAGFGMWNWDLKKDIISYNDEYLSMLGYTQDEIDGSLAEWEKMNHPEDLVLVSKLLDEFVIGARDTYECEIRMKHKDGHYIWTKDVGRIVSKDENGVATRVVGGHLNIDNLKNSQFQLEATLKELENHQAHLENEIELRTKTLIEQDQLLIAVNDVSQRMLAVDETENFDAVLIDCLKVLTTAFNTSEFTLWRYKKISDKGFFYLTHMYREETDDKIIFNVKDIEEYITNLISGGEDFQIHTREDQNIIINYSTITQELREIFETNKAISDFMSGMENDWKEDVQEQIENSDSSIASSIFLYNNLYGMIATGSNSKNIKYSEAHESMLDISGKLFANAIHRAEVDEELRLAHEEALLSSKAKSNFLANMSHEIRTPMNAISGMAEIILRESNGRGVAEHAADIKTSCDSLLTIINDILDISKIESGKLDVVETQYYLSSALNDIINMARMRIGNKPLSFFTYIDSTLPAKLFGDEIRIKQILINLLNNAIKFTHSGYFGLKVTGKAVGDKFNLFFEVFDSGMGIKEKDLERLFEEFERVNTTKNRNIEGTGLGLAITKNLCEMMGGKISVKSVYGEGSVFSASVEQICKDYEPIAVCPNKKSILLYEPRDIHVDSITYAIENLDLDCTVCTNQSTVLEQLQQSYFDFIFTPSLHLKKISELKQSLKLKSKIVVLSELHEVEPLDDVYSITLPVNCIQVANVINNNFNNGSINSTLLQFVAPKAKILVVDDNSVNLKVASGLMEPYKFKIDTALSGFEAIELIKVNRYDLVFMDHMMPEMDGIDTAIAIRKLDDDYYKKVPIIALTANAIVGARELFIKEGMNDFLAKPIELTKLNEVLNRWLPKDLLQPIKTQQQLDSEEQGSLDINIQGLNVSHGLKLLGGNETMYLDILKTYYTEGRKKLKIIDDYYTQGDLLAFRTEVHAIKSSSASIGALTLSGKAAQMERAAENMEHGYIANHIKGFLATFSGILNGIEDYLASSDVVIDSEKTAGDIALLKAEVDLLSEAVSYVNIVDIEKILNKLSLYVWGEELDQLLEKTRSEIESYDYDVAAELVEQIEQLLKKL